MTAARRTERPRLPARPATGSPRWAAALCLAGCLGSACGSSTAARDAELPAPIAAPLVARERLLHDLAQQQQAARARAAVADDTIVNDR